MASSWRAVGPHQLQGGLGPFQIAAFEIGARQARHGFGMARLVLQHMAIGLGRHGDIAGRQRLGRHRQHFGGVFGAAMVMHAMVMAVLVRRRLPARRRRP